MSTVLGIDIGTQSLKVLIYDYVQKKCLDVASSPLEIERDDYGKAEQHPEWWVNALANALEKVDPHLRAKVEAVGVSGQQHGFVALDESGNVLAPAKLWCDTSTQPEVDTLMERMGGFEQSIALTGNPMITGYTAPKILWLKNHRPELYEQLRWVLLPHDYMNYILTGRTVMEYGDASGTGLLNVHARTWSQDAIKAIDASGKILHCLPELLNYDQVAGYVTTEAAKRFGIPEGVLVSTGGGDNMMGAIGTGNLSKGTLTMSLGTSGTVYAYSDEPVIDEKGLIAAFCSSTGGWLPLLCTMNCTVSTELIRNLFGTGVNQFDAVVGAIPPGSDGVITLPFFNGERTPNLPNARGCVIGLGSNNTSSAHLLRSAAEGAIFSLKYGVDLLNDLGIEANEIVLTGGGANSEEWRRIVADVCGLPVIVYEQDEGAAFGAALQASWLLSRQHGSNDDFATLVKSQLSVDQKRSVEPDSKNHQIYQQSYKCYQDAVARIAPLYK